MPAPIATASCRSRPRLDATAPAEALQEDCARDLDVDHDLVAVALAQVPELMAEYIRQVAAWFADRADDAPV